MSIFHLAINVTDLSKARAFYGGLLGCKEGRSTDTWVDFDFFGHQLSLHLGEPFKVENTGEVDGAKVSMPHFGAVLAMDEWRTLAEHLSKNGIAFILPPSIRFEGEPGEQSTMFFLDPSGNPIEIKGIASQRAVFSP